MHDDVEKVPGVGSDKGSPQAKRVADRLAVGVGAKKRSRVDAGEEGEGAVGRLTGRTGAGVGEASVADATRLSQGSIARCIPYVSGQLGPALQHFFVY